MIPVLVVMGVSGSGKTTVGQLLALRLGVPFEDADDLHPRANIALMAAGHPLTDEDRWPWLKKVGLALRESASSGLVMACSTLKHSYRDAILAVEPGTRFVFLDGSRELLADRVLHRHGHFMPPELLDSQLAALEPLAPDEPGVTIDLTPNQTPRQLAEIAVRRLTRDRVDSDDDGAEE